ncbi:class I SAM-dependent methyltransferase [Aestuariibacter sp. AA17]|uniref:Class I SAM-dependent methyltransferase n=1 Tax=Fluctibacter corallii TaxID=2984329 RepID=A0ABT3A9T7_9ALTE|nr:class I SAM-dependent methyltransferase [Aestuariibacter sp. AA17]MCV2885450.1 class I SAM-dependent methyltransferase [Aestuariibacter sp. AA17]
MISENNTAETVKSFSASTEKKIYIGCGEDRREGYLHCDLRELEGIDVVCNAWEVSQHITGLTDIYSRHMLEHLTSMEAEAALIDWHNALAIEGTVYIVVPNMDFHIQQWLKADWNESTIKDPNSDARYGFAGIFGWQRECDPRSGNYENTYWDVHKSGYNEKRMRFLLERAGFVDIKIEIKNDVHLVATAKKTMQRGERQISSSLENIRQDHVNRYRFAAEQLNNASVESILDLATGIGYGAKLLADTTAANVTAVDIDSAAIEFAQKHYQAKNVTYLCQDARESSFQSLFDAIVSFETIEHVKFDKELMTFFYQNLTENGIFICSTPNEINMPFSKEKFKFHEKHYTPDEIISMVRQVGFTDIDVYSQKDNVQGQIQQGYDGVFTILVCRKSATESV